MKAVNVVVWGLGNHAIKNILPALKLCSGINLYGVCSRNQETVSRYANEYSCTFWIDSKQMLNDPQVDVIYLSTPTGLHASQGEEVLLAGKHLWCEKPLTETLAQTTALVDLSRERGLTLAEGFMYLYHHQFKHFKEILNSGLLGNIQSLTLRFGIPSLARPGFRLDPKLGGGALLDVGSYPISAIASFFPDKIPEVLFSESVIDPACPVDLGGRSVLLYDSGTRVILEWGTHCSYRNEVDFWGSKGSVSSGHFFSKPADYVPKFRFLDLNGHERYELGQSENHFLTMFGTFRNLLVHSIDAENERMMITRRAQLTDKIKRART